MEITSRSKVARMEVEDVQQAIVRKEHAQFRGEGQEDLEESPPLKPGWIQVLQVRGIIADRAHIVGLESGVR